MKTIKIADLTELQLDWAVATCVGYSVSISESGEVIILRECVVDYFDPHHNWGWGGPIIEHHITKLEDYGDCWGAEGVDAAEHFGPTPLIAAMRCYVASKLGDEVEIPEELI